ncbi:MAG: tetratricopeptide repeat protein [Limisphaerales bacterium]
MQPGEWKTLSARILVLLVAATVSGLAATPKTIDPAKLRRLVELPEVNVSFGVGYYDTRFVSFHGCTRSGNSESPGQAQTDIAALRRQLKGDATDAARYSRLGDLYSDADDSTNSDRAYRQAVELYRPQANEQPTNARLLVDFGQALSDGNQDAESEQVFRQAVRVAPDQWKCWTGLGGALERQAQRLLMRAAFQDAAWNFEDEESLKKIAGKLLQHPPSAGQTQTAARIGTTVRGDEISFVASRFRRARKRFSSGFEVLPHPDRRQGENAPDFLRALRP